MNRPLLHLLIFLLLSIEAFSQEQFRITIDSVCFQENDTIPLNGTFGLYGDMRISEHPFWVKDTLINTLEFKKEQVLELEPMPYTIRFIPDDTTERSHSVPIHSQSNYKNLSCFFFNKSYPLVLRTMKNNDYIKIVSKYAGPTNMEMAIPIFSLMIVKKRSKYFLKYWESETNEQGLRFIDLQTQPSKDKNIKIDDSYLKLTEEQLKMIEDFWSRMNNYWFDNDYSSIPSQTTIYDENGYVSFQSNEYISKLLWNELN